MPARSAIWHMAAMSSQLAAQRSGARLMVRPPSQLALNTPSLNLFGPRMGLVVRVSVIEVTARYIPAPSPPVICVSHHRHAVASGR